MAFTLDNFVRSILAVDAAIGDTSLVVALAAPPLRDPPAASAGAPGILILQDQPTAPTKIEIVTYTGVSIVGTQVTLTGVTRGLEGTSAQAWTAGTQTFSGTTAAVLAQFALKAALAAVATSGSYTDLADKPTLGTAAAADASAFATAGQGAEADSALQPGDVGSAAFASTAAFATSTQGAKADAAMPKAGGAFTGAISTPSFVVSAPVASFPGMGIQDSGVYRWSWTMFTDYSFQLVRYNSAGANQGSAVVVDPATGAFAFAAGISAPTVTVGGVPISVVSGFLKLDGAWAQMSTVQCSGSLTATSVTDTSDARLKTHIRRDRDRWRGIRRKVEMVLYDRIDGPDDEPGVIAQEVQQFAPEFVGATADGILTVHYGKLALACALDPEPLA